MSEREVKSFPKIWALGSKYSQGIFNTEIEITEKIDGSQFGFTFDGEKLIVRSKGAVINLDNVPNLFGLSVNHVVSVRMLLDPDYIYYGEAVCKPRHNTLTYKNVPLNNIALFAVYDVIDQRWLHYSEMKKEADRIEVDCVPLLYSGQGSVEIAKGLINKPSYLGGCDAEGIVVKAFKDIEIAGVVYPIHSAKYVTEKFKERHSHNKQFKSGKSNAHEFFEQFNTEARFLKAVSKLREGGEYQGEPKDIGKLMKLLNEDLVEECKEDVKDELWNIYRKDFLKIATNGFPQWFKDSLLTGDDSDE